MNDSLLDRGSESLLRREGSFVFTNEVSKYMYRWFGVYSMNKTGGRRKMFN